MIPCYNIIEIKKILIFFDLTKAINYTMKDIQGKHVDYQPSTNLLDTADPR